MAVRNRLCCLCVVILIVLMSSACSLSKESAGVPDAVVSSLAESYLSSKGLTKSDYNEYSVKVTHDIDRNSHIDYASIELIIEYNYITEHVYTSAWYSYDRSSDTWRLTNTWEFGDPEYEIKYKYLTGAWTVYAKDWRYDDYSFFADMNVKSANSKECEIEYYIMVRSSSGDACTYDGKGTFPFSEKEKSITMVFDLPEGNYVYGASNTKMDKAKIRIFIDNQEGFNSAIVVGTN